MLTINVRIGGALKNRLVALTLKVRLTNDWWGKFLSDFYAYYINRL